MTSRWNSNRVRRRLLLPAGLIVVGSATPLTARAQTRIVEWQQYSDPAEAGFSVSDLDNVRRYADSVRSGAVMVVYRGRVLAAWGDVDRKFGLHSVRKSLVSALYGIEIAEKKIDLNETLGHLGIEDHEQLTAGEKSAKVRDIISAKSGVYLPAAYAPADQDQERPARGAYAPGTHWFYNNWDFNIAGVIYQKKTGEGLYDAFLRRIAKPIGMQDYAVTDGLEVLEPGNSIHPAHTLRMSTRDLARFGELYLQQGRWNGKQVIPAAWVRESTSSKTEVAPKQGYGYMWWTYDVDSGSTKYPAVSRHALYQARGTGGQVVFIIPDEEMVIVLRGDTDNNRNVNGTASWTIADRIVAARKSEPTRSPRLVALSPVPFKSQAPAPPEQNFLALERSALEKLAGNYAMGPNAIARAFIYQRRLFMFFPGQGEAELYALSPTDFTIQVQAGVNIKFVVDAQGSATGFEARLGPQVIRGTRTQ